MCESATRPDLEVPNDRKHSVGNRGLRTRKIPQRPALGRPRHPKVRVAGLKDQRYWRDAKNDSAKRGRPPKVQRVPRLRVGAHATRGHLGSWKTHRVERCSVHSRYRQPLWSTGETQRSPHSYESPRKAWHQESKSAAVGIYNEPGREGWKYAAIGAGRRNQ